MRDVYKRQGLLSTVIALLGVAVLITYSPQNGVILLVMAFLISPMAVSYTHLDVYKRQEQDGSPHYVTADEYLSGNVRRKLRQAQRARCV